MNRRVARSVGVPSSATHTASGRASRKTIATNASDGQPSRVSACEGEQRAEHEEDAELDDLDELVGAALEVLAQVGAADAEHDRGDEHGDEAVAFGREHGQPVGGERDAEREQRLLVGGDRVLQRAVSRARSRGISSEASQPQARP